MNCVTLCLPFVQKTPIMGEGLCVCVEELYFVGLGQFLCELFLFLRGSCAPP